jgi:hypothetical protein
MYVLWKCKQFLLHMWHPQGSGQSTVDVVNFVKGRQEITTMNTYPLSFIKQKLRERENNNEWINVFTMYVFYLYSYVIWHVVSILYLPFLQFSTRSVICLIQISLFKFTRSFYPVFECQMAVQITF